MVHIELDSVSYTEFKSEMKSPAEFERTLKFFLSLGFWVAHSVFWAITSLLGALIWIYQI